MGKIEWAVASRPIPGQTQSGDLHLVAPRPEGVLLAVIDGLGHGPEAAMAAHEAVSVLACAPADDIIELMRRCDVAIKHTRGAVMNVAAISYDDDSLTWGGIGNVNGIVYRSDPNAKPPQQRLAPRPGIIGSGIARPASENVPIFEDDVLVFATDGLASILFDKFEPGRLEPAESMATRMIDECWTHRDDVLVLVACYGGG